MPPLAPVWMPQSEWGGWGGPGQKSHRGHRSQHTSHHQNLHPESGLGLLRHPVPRTAGDRQGGAEWTPCAEASPLRAAVRGPLPAEVP